LPGAVRSAQISEGVHTLDLLPPRQPFKLAACVAQLEHAVVSQLGPEVSPKQDFDDRESAKLDEE